MDIRAEIQTRVDEIEQIIKRYLPEEEGWQKTIVVVLHDMNQAWQYADEVVIMKDGALVCTGPPQAVLTPERLWDVFSVRTDIVTTSDGRSAIVVLQ